MKKMTRTKIEYKAGMARDGIEAVDYMLGNVVTEEGVIELYAEFPTSDDGPGTYEILCCAILEQAVKQGVDIDSLDFFYD